MAAAKSVSCITYSVEAIKGLILKAANFLRRPFGLKSNIELEYSSTIRKGAGMNEREFTIWMKKNVPHIKWRIGEEGTEGDCVITVYEDTEEPQKMKVYDWESCLEPFIDFFFGEALEKMKALTQPKEAPLTCTDEVVELMVFAKKEGYEVECFAYTHKIPYDFQYTIKGPDGYKFETEATFWEPGCWRDAAEELGRVCKKEFEFTKDRKKRERLERANEESKHVRLVSHEHCYSRTR